jgi:hypothetical protein
MTALFESGLIEVSNKWISITNRTELTEALNKKNLELKKNYAKALTKSDKLQILNEMKILFPQDQDLAIFMNQFMVESFDKNEQSERDKKRKYAFGFIILALSTMSLIVFLQRYFNGVATQTTNMTPKTTATKTTTDGPLSTNVISPDFLKKESPPPQTKHESIKSSSAAISKFGFLNLQVPNEVDVFVGGRYIPVDQREKLKLETGKHLVKMVMDGYLPIENTVTVKPGKITLVKAGGAQ